MSGQSEKRTVQYNLLNNPIILEKDESDDAVRLWTDPQSRIEMYEVKGRHYLKLKDQIKAAPRIIEVMISGLHIPREDIIKITELSFEDAVKLLLDFFNPEK